MAHMAKRTFHLSDEDARALLATELSTDDAAWITGESLYISGGNRG